MEVKLYVGNLPFDMAEDAIREMFAQSGTVVSVALIKDRSTGYSKGFAFVEMSSQKEGHEAIKELNGRTIGDRQLAVSFAKAREELHGLPKRNNFRAHGSRGKGKRY